MNTPFGEIMQRVVDETPGAIGGAFAASDGEMVDAYSTWDEDEWAIFTAHYGIVVQHIRSAIHTFHYGDVETMYVGHDRLDVLAQVVAEGYFALMALTPPANLGAAQHRLEQAAEELRKEMF